MNKSPILGSMAVWISKLTHPSLLIFLLLLVAFITSFSPAQVTNFLISSILLAIVPVSAISLWSKRVGESGGEISSSSNRQIPYLISIASFVLCAVILLFFTDNFPYPFIAVSILFSTILLWFGNYFTKVSVHAGGVSAVCSLCICMFQLWSLPLILLIGVVLWSRLYLKKHTVAQLIYSTLIGFLTPLFLYYVLNIWTV
jgi:hypothetical protein